MTGVIVGEIKKPGPLDWIDDFELSEEDMDNIQTQQYAVPGLIPVGQVTTIIGRAGVGKTTIIFDLARTMVERGYIVVYAHADTYPSEAKTFRLRAIEDGIRYLTPDMKVGMTMQNVLTKFHTMAKSGDDLENIVIVFDTVKKLTNMIQKSNLAALMRVLRTIVGRGATVVLLGHVNKHKSPDGFEVYEGTGDLENDSDNLIYLVASPDDAGIIVSTVCKPSDGMGKMRADIKKLSWRITQDRSVFTLDEYRDTEAMQIEAARLDADSTYIEAITLALESGQHTQVDITTWCKSNYGHSEKRTRAVLSRWKNKLWTRKKGSEKNAFCHELL